MKKTCCTLLVSLAGVFLAAAQTEESTATNPAPAAAVVQETNSAQPAAAAPEAVPEQPIASPEASVPQAMTTEASVSQPATNSMDAAGQTAAASDEIAATNAPTAVAVGIPQIRFSDVPITTAIENLARLANINYMMDPKIGYGQPDANGQIKVEPTLSIRWENITAENALLALLDNYGLQLVHDKKTGIDRITMKDPTAPPPLYTKVVQLKYASVSNMIDAAQSVLTDKRSKVLTDSRTSQLVVVATDPEQAAIEALVSQLDKPTRQVLIETRLVEISSNPKTKKGVDWTGTLQNYNVGFGNTLNVAQTATTPGFDAPYNDGMALGSPGLVANTASGFGSMGFLNADGLNATLSFLNSSSEAQIMSTPRIVTLDNEKAKISVTRGYPVFSVQAGTQNTAGGSQVAYTNVGTVLNVTPRISANDYIWLRVVPEVSSFAGNFAGPVVGTGSDATALTAPLFDVRTLETQVLIPNANTLVLGGLVNDNPTKDSTKVPLLGDIPGLGFIFRSEDKALIKANLLIFITPTIVKDDDFQVAHSGEFLKSKPQAMKDPMDPKTAWDGPVPAGEWSNPITESTK